MVNNVLIDESLWIDPYIEVKDGAKIVRFYLQDCLRYHGEDALGGVVLGFRLLQKASAILADGVLDRRSLTVFTSFPGLGVRDVFELIMRLVLDNRFTLDVDFIHADVPAGVRGSFYFRFSYQGKEVELAPIKGAPSSEFIHIGRQSKLADVSTATLIQWCNEKIKLANLLLQKTADDVIRVL